MPAWIGALFGVAALLTAAKAHGRQIRLERESQGYHQVVFGGTNPQFVEALWRRDRIRFWSTVAIFAILLCAAAWWARGAGLALVAAFLWAPIGGFLVAGLRSYAQQRGRGGPVWWLAAGVSTAVAVVVAVV